MFTCKRCDCTFTQKNNLLKHYHKKKACTSLPDKDYDLHELIKEITKAEPFEKKENIFICDNCEKGFNKRFNFQRHQSICLKDNMKLPITLNTNINNTTLGNTTHIVSNNGVIVNQPVHITINALGSESKSYLNEDLIKNIFLQRFDGLLEAFRQKHLNNGIPENNNLRKNVHKDSFIESYDGSEWKTKNFETVLTDCFKSMGYEIFEFLKDNQNINFTNMSEEQKNTVLNSFMHYIAKPLNWQLITDTDFMKNYQDNYNHTDPIGENKKRKTIFQLATENVYKYTVSKRAKECPF